MGFLAEHSSHCFDLQPIARMGVCIEREKMIAPIESGEVEMTALEVDGFDSLNNERYTPDSA